VTHRERILVALQHKEPDRVPIDLGGTESSGMTAAAYTRLERHLGLPVGCRVFEPYQHVAFIEHQLQDLFDLAAYPVIPEPRRWRAATLPDGTSCELPEGWRTAPRPDGTEEAIDAAGEVVGRRAASGHHFDPVNPPLAQVETPADLAGHGEAITRFDWPGFADETPEEMAARARRLRERSDRAAILNFQSHLLAAGQILRGFETFMADLLLRPKLAEALLAELVDAYCERADRLFAVLGDSVDVVLVNDDLGTQQGPMLSPELYRRAVKPHQQRLFAHLKAAGGAPLLLHSCGSVRYAIPDLIEIGVDALNPVQVSAAGMDPAELKREFGKDISFWGGGCDTQQVLNRGSAREVRDEVERRIDQLAAGGGFVFCQVHNVQPEVPPENVVAMLEAAAQFGRY
jgi:uroporphyrinogen decarboxylase